jgi:hypothetical protein
LCGEPSQWPRISPDNGSIGVQCNGELLLATALQTERACAMLSLLLNEYR